MFIRGRRLFEGGAYSSAAFIIYYDPALRGRMETIRPKSKQGNTIQLT